MCEKKLLPTKRRHILQLMFWSSNVHSNSILHLSHETSEKTTRILTHLLNGLQTYDLTENWNSSTNIRKLSCYQMTWIFWHRRTHRYFNRHSAGGRTLLTINAINLFSYISRKHTDVRHLANVRAACRLYSKILLYIKHRPISTSGIYFSQRCFTKEISA